jgi:hypothetical protein
MWIIRLYIDWDNWLLIEIWCPPKLFTLCFFYTLIHSRIYYIYAHSVLCWKMSNIIDFEYKLTKL